MSTLTKVELQQINTRLATENAALRVKVADLEADIRRITDVASAMNKSTSMPRWQVERAEAMRIARGMAMATRMVVKV